MSFLTKGCLSPPDRRSLNNQTVATQALAPQLNLTQGIRESRLLPAQEIVNSARELFGHRDTSILQLGEVRSPRSVKKRFSVNDIAESHKFLPQIHQSPEHIKIQKEPEEEAPVDGPVDEVAVSS